MANFDKLGDRMKNYENVERKFLTRRTPCIIRLDGKAFHTYTKNFNRPFDVNLYNAFKFSTIGLMQEIQGAKFAYIQSDECSIVVSDYDTINTDAWFGYNVQKMVSISSSIYTLKFNTLVDVLRGPYDGILPPAYFDARVFNIPEDEILNYLIWRQSDWTRNSIQSLCRTYYSQKQMAGKKQPDMHDMIVAAGDNWNNLEPKWKNGTFIYHVEQNINHNFPIFQSEEGRKQVGDLIAKFRT